MFAFPIQFFGVFIGPVSLARHRHRQDRNDTKFEIIFYISTLDALFAHDVVLTSWMAGLENRE
jgi:hypothetical protein